MNDMSYVSTTERVKTWMDGSVLHIDSDVPGAQVFMDREFLGAAAHLLLQHDRRLEKAVARIVRAGGGFGFARFAGACVAAVMPAPGGQCRPTGALIDPSAARATRRRNGRRRCGAG